MMAHPTFYISTFTVKSLRQSTIYLVVIVVPAPPMLNPVHMSLIIRMLPTPSKRRDRVSDLEKYNIAAIQTATKRLVNPVQRNHTKIRTLLYCLALNVRLFLLFLLPGLIFGVYGSILSMVCGL